MFDDKRSKKVLLVAHCILNQNAKIDRCAYYPGIMREVAEALIEAGVGIIQMPCPELIYLGLDRQADREAPTSVESEDTRVAGRMAEEGGLACCRLFATALVNQVQAYQKFGFEVLGIVGINGSPTCGVETGWRNDQEVQGPGIFVQILREELGRQGISLPMRGVKGYEPRQAVAKLMELIAGRGGAAEGGEN